MSDGNFTSVPIENTQGTQRGFYVQLPYFQPRPHLRALIPSAPPWIVEGEPCTIHVHLAGFTSAPSTLKVLAFASARKLIRLEVPVDSGWFDRLQPIALPGLPRGNHSLSVHVQNDSSRSACHTTISVIPNTLTIALIAHRPTLDKRFFSLSIARSTRWRIVDSTEYAKADAAIVFGWSGTLPTRLPERIPILFVGAPPAASVSRMYPKTISVTSRKWRLPSSLPPPAAVYVYRQPLFATVDTLAAMQWEGDSLARRSAPMAVEARFRGRSAIVVPVEGVWRGDFWPLMSENPTHFLSQEVLHELERKTISGLANALWVHPSESHLVEGKPIRMNINLPASYVNDSALLGISVTDSASNRVVVDTVMRISPRSLFAILPALGPGVYNYTCRLGSSSESTHVGQMVINTDNSELIIRGQNTEVLDQIALMVPYDTLALKSVLETKHLTENAIVTTVRIRRTLPLLLALLALVCTEWSLRKRFDSR